MKPFICLIISLFMVLMPPESEAQIRKKAKQKAVRYSIHIDDLQVRDPFILADPQSGNYYLHVNDTYRLICYESRDLIHWRYCGKSFVPATDFWGKRRFLGSGSLLLSEPLLSVCNLQRARPKTRHLDFGL